MKRVDLSLPLRKLRSLAMKKEILYRSALFVAAIVTTTTLHEVVHLIVGRSLSIPAQFLNYTSVGIPTTNVVQYPPMSLAAMNGVAPIFSILFFGALPLLVITKDNPNVGEPWFSLLKWSAIFNVPYLGLQLMLAVNVSSANGSGSDMAAVMGAFEAPSHVRFVLGALGYLFFVASLVILGRALSKKPNVWPSPHNELRKWLGYFSILLGFLSVCFGDRITLSGNQNLGMTLIAIGGFFLLGIGSTLLIYFKSSNYPTFKVQWLLPTLVGTFFMALIGVFFQNDYANFWLILIPSVLAIGAVMTGSSAKTEQ